jgi:predicted nuclease of predicted toxin-antitoxin system
LRFLVDAQLPPALARRIESLGHISEHVANRGLAKAAENEIRAHAAETGSVIMTWVKCEAIIDTRVVIARIEVHIATLCG